MKRFMLVSVLTVSALASQQRWPIRTWRKQKLHGCHAVSQNGGPASRKWLQVRWPKNLKQAWRKS